MAGLNRTFIDEPDQAPCYQTILIGVYCILLFCASSVANSVLLWIFYKNKQLRTPLNNCVICIAILNLIGTIIELPLVAVNAFACRRVFAHFVCIIEAFVMYFIACVTIYVMVIMSFERYWVVFKPYEIRNFSYRMFKIGMILCTLMGLFWSIAPLIGWSYYSPEGLGISCSVEWQDRSSNVISYNITMFIFVYFLPLLLIAITNLKIAFIIRKTIKRWESQQDPNILERRQFRKERQLVVMTVVLIVGFVVSWTPYAIACLYVAFFNTTLPPLVATIPAFFAKASLLWPSLLNILTNNDIKTRLPFKNIRQVFPFTLNATFKRSSRNNQ